MLPELLHVKELKETTLHNTRHKSQRQNYDGLHDSYNYTFKKMLKERKEFFTVKCQNVGIFCIGRNVQKQRLTGVH